MSDRIRNTAEEKLFKRNFKKFGLDMNPVVSIGAGLIILIFSVYAFVDLERANTLFNKVNASISSNFDWLFILGTNFFILVSLIMAFSKLGHVRIGGVDAEPEFSNFSWYSMLMSAGMGIGLMFWSVGEPLYHMATTPPIFAGATSDAQAMATTFFHWGLHPWGIYALISLALAFFAYNKKLPLSLRSVFYPLLKDKIFGFWGDMIDILAVVACLFGLATSLGLGVQQINSGLNYLFGVDINSTVQVLLIIGITMLATMSVVSGIDKGVKFLSEINIKIAGIFMLIVFILGPSAYIIRLFGNSLGVYLNDFIEASFFIGDRESTWQAGWSVFYLAWWISWSPFVGMFIARISKGRTIREFVLAVLIIPSLLSFLWLSTFGGTAIYIDALQNGALLETVGSNLPVALFEMIQYLEAPILQGIVRTILSVVGTILVVSFFVTSSDSGSLVVDNITSGGKLNSPVTQRVFWASMEGLVAIVLLLIGGEAALKALQTAVIATGLPFAILMIVMSLMLVDSVRKAYKKQKLVKDLEHFETMMEEYESSEESVA
jgi:choline/glycine/proline betaine transport protein/BCCT family betaine/carnitine transporter